MRRLENEGITHHVPECAVLYLEFRLDLTEVGPLCTEFRSNLLFLTLPQAQVARRPGVVSGDHHIVRPHHPLDDVKEETTGKAEETYLISASPSTFAVCTEMGLSGIMVDREYGWSASIQCRGYRLTN